MRSTTLYKKLDNDFIKEGLSDDWAQYMGEVNDFLTEGFKRRSMGLVCDNARSIKRVYTAVFPSKDVLGEIIKDGAKDALLFVHHPSIWDIRRNPVFYQMGKADLRKLKENRISIYNLHVPLDNRGEYSTSTTLAKALGLTPKRPFAPYHGALAGIIGVSKFRLVEELQERFEKAVGHDVRLYAYGQKTIKDGKVAVIAGGGNNLPELKEVRAFGINTFVTGITALNEYSKPAHEYAKKNKINILGGTHYSTEKFACIEMCRYFERLSLPSRFIEDTPVIEDM